MSTKKLFSIFALFVYLSSLFIPIASASEIGDGNCSSFKKIDSLHPFIQKEIHKIIKYEKEDTGGDVQSHENVSKEKDAQTNETPTTTEASESTKKLSSDDEDALFQKEMNAMKLDPDALKCLEKWIYENKFKADRSETKLIYKYYVLENDIRVQHRDIYIDSNKNVTVVTKDINKDGASLLSTTEVGKKDGFTWYHFNVSISIYIQEQNRNHKAFTDLCQLICPDYVADFIFKNVQKTLKTIVEIEGHYKVDSSKNIKGLYIEKLFIYPSEKTLFMPNISYYLYHSEDYISISLTQNTLIGIKTKHFGLNGIYNTTNSLITIQFQRDGTTEHVQVFSIPILNSGANNEKP